MKTGNQLIQKTFHSILIVNAVSMVSAILCTLIDSIVTGQFLGTEAITAAGLITPVVLMTNLLGALLGPGVTVVCSRLIGMAQPKRSNQAFSLVVITDILALGTVSVLLYAASPAIARLLGSATGSAQIVQMITDYLHGFSFGLLPMCLTMGLTGLMLLDNDRKCGLLTMFVTLGADVTFDLANALFFHRGMMGMAIATSLSYVLGLCVLLTHFTKKDRILHFTLQGLRPGDLKDVVLCGIPSVITMGSQVLRGLIFNVLLLSVAGSSAVASLAVANAAFSVINVLGISMFNSTTTLCSMLYGEEDRTGLLTAQAVAMRTVTACFAVIAALVLLLARPIAGLFLNASAVEELTQAARLIRLLAVQNGLYSLSYSLCGGYQGTHKLKMNYSLAFLREGILPLLCIAGLGLLLGLRGFEMGYVAVGSLTLLLCFLIPAVKNGKLSAAPEDLLMLSPAFGARPEDLLEAEMTTMDEVMAVSRQVMQFCRDKGAPDRTALLTSLFVEEMAGNTVQHGFPKGRAGSIGLRLVYGEQSKVIRLRDNGMPFDPVDWLERNRPEDPSATTGISLIVGLAKDVQYIPAMGLNNLMVLL